jgi:hypothetical protein
MGLFSEYTPRTRAGLFYGVCLPLRVAIAFAVIFLALTWYKPTMIALVALASVMFVTEVYLHYHPRGWWFHGAHAFTSLLMIIVASFALDAPEEKYYPFAVGGIVITDFSIGFVTSIGAFGPVRKTRS